MKATFTGRRPRLLDLCCGAGGAAMGYHRAGFDVTGVDIEPQPHYPFTFTQADALDVDLDGFDVIHASPPCQAYSAMARMAPTSALRLVDVMRARLQAQGAPYVIENVEGAPLIEPIVLCGSMFDLAVRRHRCFEVWPVLTTTPPACQCRHGVRDGWLIAHRTHGAVRQGRIKPPAHTEAERRAAIGVPWMPARTARQAIPPAYTRWVGRQLLDAVAVTHGR